ncbi:MAG: NAD/FAD-binding protein [Maricaulis sp.]|jgi:predicted NAD/FAD-binding protein|nr:NAD/FAD-binding protein [Maricaulis sp.]
MTEIVSLKQPRARVAVIGSGISGLGAAWALRHSHDVTLFEKRDRLGGHSATVDIDYDGTPLSVDTGFIVFNPLNYPNLVALFEHLGIATHQTDMSFGFAVKQGLEWCSNGLGGVFAQKRNMARPSFLLMLRDILRFNDLAPAALDAGELRGLSLGQFLTRHNFSDGFREHYLLPMGAAIWSSTETGMLDYPAEALIRFFRNHRLMNIKRPQWRTVTGGSRTYVDAIARELGDRVRLSTPVREIRRIDGKVVIVLEGGISEVFDEVILACHSDQALAMMPDADPDERELLGTIPYSANQVALHRDPSFMPDRKSAHAAWNYVRREPNAAACVTYDMNKLQGLSADKPVFVTLNPDRLPDPDLTFGVYEYDHPQFSGVGLAAQRVFNRIQGRRQTWFAGAWLGYGFHEDGLRSGLRVALKLGGTIPWNFAEGDVDGGPWGGLLPDAAERAARVAAE